MPDSMSNHRRSRSRFTFGIILLLIGAWALADQLGFDVPRDWWNNWPWLLIVMGALQFAWPGNLWERLAGFWLIAVGAWGLVNIYGLFGLHWGTSWPILVIALGLRVVLGGLFRRSNS